MVSIDGFVSCYILLMLYINIIMVLLLLLL